MPKSGRARKTTPRMDRRIKRISQNGYWKSAFRMIVKIPEIEVGYLFEAKLFSRPIISSKNRFAVLDFAQRHLNWTVHDWAKVYLAMKAVTKYIIPTK